MRKFQLHKLVRDKMITAMESSGQIPTWRTVDDDDEYHRLLAEKHVEEAKEYDPSDPKGAIELADSLETTEALARLRGLSFEQLRELQLKQREERGGFTGRILVESVEADGEWANYYAKEPERFPEEPQTDKR